MAAVAKAAARIAKVRIHWNGCDTCRFIWHLLSLGAIPCAQSPLPAWLIPPAGQTALRPYLAPRLLAPASPAPEPVLVMRQRRLAELAVRPDAWPPGL